MKTTNTRAATILLALVPLLAGASPCEPEMPLGGDDAGMRPATDAGPVSGDAGAVTPSGDAGIAADAGGTVSDGGTPTTLDFTEAATICGRLSGCLGGQMWLNAPCLTVMATPTTATEYRDWMDGRGFTRFVGGPVSDTSPLDPKLGLLDRSELGVVESIAAAPAVRSCLLAATTCGDVHACLNDGAPSSACTPDADSTLCDGDTVRACIYSDWELTDDFPPDVVGIDGVEVAFDCSTQGNACVQGRDGSYVYGCAPEACNAVTDSVYGHCEGNTIVSCNRGIVDRRDCPVDTVCTDTATDAFCAGTGATCSETMDDYCDGDVLVSCSGGRLHRQECAGPFRCVTSAAGAACALGTECNPWESATCDTGSGVVSACAMGVTVDIDCRSLGFAGCDDRFLWAGHCR